MRRLLVAILVCLPLTVSAAGHKSKKRATAKPKPAEIVTSNTTLPADAVSTVASSSPSAHPSLVSTVDLQTGDSALVRAAKTAVARRQQSTVPVIDAKVLERAKGDTFSEPDHPYPLPDEIRRANAPQRVVAEQAAPEPDRTPTRADIEKRIAGLKKEQERLAAESEQPYGGEVPGDQIEKRMTEIQKELAALNKSLATAPGKQ
jgi:hypothetical protein